MKFCPTYTASSYRSSISRFSGVFAIWCNNHSRLSRAERGRMGGWITRLHTTSTDNDATSQSASERAGGRGRRVSERKRRHRVPKSCNYCPPRRFLLCSVIAAVKRRLDSFALGESSAASSQPTWRRLVYRPVKPASQREGGSAQLRRRG